MALAEKIRTSRATLESERKQVTVLFADIKGSTELLRDLAPEAAQQLLDPALHAMMDAVHRYESGMSPAPPWTGSACMQQASSNTPPARPRRSPRAAHR
jgi:hypothetical protein